MLITTIAKMFENGNCSVFGLRGRGKDMLTANVIARRKKPYISNIDYKTKTECIPLDLTQFDCKNTYKNFIDGDINEYTYPYADGIDVYISDCGVYLPAQYCDKLTREYSYLPTFFALSRQLGLCNVHCNSQALNRVWDKIREQSDTYISCQKCIVVGKLVFQKVYIYERYDSALAGIAPFRIPPRPLGMNADMYRQSVVKARTDFDNLHGTIRKHWLIYFNKSKYDTRHFKTLLQGDLTK